MKKINIEDLDNPCIECLLVFNCHTECGEKAAHKILQYLNSPSIDPNSCIITSTQKTKTKELVIHDFIEVEGEDAKSIHSNNKG